MNDHDARLRLRGMRVSGARGLGSRSRAGDAATAMNLAGKVAKHSGTREFVEHEFSDGNLSTQGGRGWHPRRACDDRSRTAKAPRSAHYLAINRCPDWGCGLQMKSL